LNLLFYRFLQFTGFAAALFDVPAGRVSQLVEAVTDRFTHVGAHVSDFVYDIAGSFLSCFFEIVRCVASSVAYILGAFASIASDVGSVRRCMCHESFSLYRNEIAGNFARVLLCTGQWGSKPYANLQITAANDFDQLS
jgi:hypothetical protein